jgi:hypothetical protein
MLASLSEPRKDPGHQRPRTGQAALPQQARLKVAGGATAARIRRPLRRKAAVAADMVRLPPVTPSGHALKREIVKRQSYNSIYRDAFGHSPFLMVDAGRDPPKPCTAHV